ncbi:RIO1 family regulatory kinase/ATPase domain-containing protein [Candidatus Hodarchaeum mangrovi]
MSIDKNQRLGYDRFGKREKDREEEKFHKITKKREIREIRIVEAKQQLLAIPEISKIRSIIGAGKEATVLLAIDTQEQFVCAKVFRFFTSTIKKRLKGTIHLFPEDMASIAAKQEYWNLKEMYEKGIPVPQPIKLKDNILLMKFISDKINEEKPAPLIRDITIADPTETLYDAVDILADLFLKAQFIHGDYSEHNLMVGEQLITMDVSQSVQYNQKTFINTPIRIRIDRAVDLLKTDLINLNKYFQRRYKVFFNTEEVLESIVKELPPRLKNFLEEKTMEIYPGEMLSTEVLNGKQSYRDMMVFQRSRRSRQKPKH